MAQPVEYERQYNFTDYQTANPADPLPGDQVDAEFNAVKQTTDQIRANLALIQRDDGALANNSVGVDQLKAEVDFGFNTITDWEVGVDYVARDGVWLEGKLYRCLVAHTSTVFADDLADEFWTLLLDVEQTVIDTTDEYLDGAAQPYVTAAAGSASAAASSATSASNSATAAATSATNAATSATNASNSATAAATSATNAATSETNAATSESNAATSETNAAASAAAAAASAATVLGPVYASTTSGTSSAYTATFVPAITTYANAQPMFFKLHTDCAAGATLNANTIGAKALYLNGAAVLTNALRANILYMGAYDGTVIHVIGAGGGGETLVSPVSAAGASQTLNYSSGNVFDLTGTASTACTLSFSNLPVSGVVGRFRVILRQPAVTGGSTWVWPASVRWYGRATQTSAPSFSTTAGYVHEVDLITVDGGTTVYAELVGGPAIASPSANSGVYVAVGTNGKLSSSTTGESFTLQASQFSGGNIAFVTYAGGRFHFGNDASNTSSTNMKYTTNGTSFTAWGNDGTGNITPKGIKEAANGSVVVEGLWYNPSSTGQSFQTSDYGGTVANRIIVNGSWTNGALSKVAFTGSDGIAILCTSNTAFGSTQSSNGWTGTGNGPSNHTGTGSGNQNCVAVLNGYVLIGYTSGDIAYKTTANYAANALTNVSSVVGSNQINKIIYTGSKWVAAANGGKIANASAIGTWTNRTTGLSGNVVDINYNGGVVMAVTDTGEIARSTDNGDSWTVLSTSGGTPPNPHGGSALKFIKFRLNNWWTGGAGGKLSQSADGQSFLLVSSGFGADTINDFDAA